jgi:hypothetical protein
LRKVRRKTVKKPEQNRPARLTKKEPYQRLCPKPRFGNTHEWMML